MEPSEKRKRPILVWIIAILHFLFGLGVLGAGLSAFYLTSDIFSLPADITDSVGGLWIFVFSYAVAALIGLFYIVVATTLFLLRKAAFHLFVTILIVNIVSVIWYIVDKGWIEFGGGTTFVTVLINWGVQVAICLYARRLIKRGILV